MMTLTPYLNFPAGKTREALEFYRKALKGEIESIQTFGDAKMDGPKDEVIHAVFKAQGARFMASTEHPQHPAKGGNNTHLCLDFTDDAEQEAAWKGLSEGATIAMPLQDMFWGARYGQLTDKYGISWMFNWQKPQG